MQRLKSISAAICACGIIAVGFSSALFAAPMECDTGKLLSDVRKNISKIQDYQLNTSVSLDKQTVSSLISGKSPHRLKIEMSVTQGSQSIKLSTVFDGTYQWIESAYPGTTQVAKVKLSSIIKPNRPFDTSYYLMGSGLLNGEDYPSSILSLLSVYKLTADCNNNKLSFSGSLDVDKFTQYINQKRSNAASFAMVKKYTESFNRLNIDFDAATLKVMGYQLGNAKSPQFLTTKFSNLNINQQLKNSDFTYTPPKNIEVNDITQDLLQQLNAKS